MRVINPVKFCANFYFGWKERRRSKAWLEDESLPPGASARIKNLPVRVIKETDPDYDMGIDYFVEGEK